MIDFYSGCISFVLILVVSGAVAILEMVVSNGDERMAMFMGWMTCVLAFCLKCAHII